MTKFLIWSFYFHVFYHSDKTCLEKAIVPLTSVSLDAEWHRKLNSSFKRSHRGLYGLARPLEPKQNVCCVDAHVRITFCCNCLRSMTNPIVGVPKVRVQLPEWQVILQLSVWRALPPHSTWDELTGSSEAHYLTAARSQWVYFPAPYCFGLLTGFWYDCFRGNDGVGGYHPDG